MPQYDDSQRSRNGFSEEVHKRPDKLKDGGMPQCDMPLQISIRWKWLKGTLRVSNDALIFMKSSGTMVSEANTIYLDRVMEIVTDM